MSMASSQITCPKNKNWWDRQTKCHSLVETVAPARGPRQQAVHKALKDFEHGNLSELKKETDAQVERRKSGKQEERKPR